MVVMVVMAVVRVANLIVVGVLYLEAVHKLCQRLRGGESENADIA